MKKGLAESRERIRAQKLEEAREQERKWLTEKHASLDKLSAAVTAGDREAMLSLIEITSETLRAFDLLSQELRNTLAKGLDDTVILLSQSPDFPRGKLSTVKKRKEAETAWCTAFHVEYLRYSTGTSLEEAEEQVANSRGISQNLVHKRWKLRHLGAKETLNVFHAIDEVTGHTPPSRKPKKKYGSWS